MLRTRAWTAAAAALLAGLATGSALGSETAERSRSLEVPIASTPALRVDNLLGSVRIQGTSNPGRVRVRASVVAEAKTSEEAERLAESVTIDAGSGAHGAFVRAALPLDGVDALRAPSGDKNPLVRFVGSVFQKRGDVEAEYGGKTVRITGDRKATALAVHLVLEVPFETAVSVRQIAGTVEIQTARGDVRLEVPHGRAAVSRLSGSLEVASEDAEVSVTSLQGKRLAIATATGDVKLLEVRANRAALRTESGRIEGKRVTADDLTVESSDGPVSFEEADAVTASIQTGSGDVDLGARLNRARGAVVRSESGSVILRVGKVVGFNLLAETRTGEVKAQGIALAVVEKSGNVSRLRFGGGGPPVEVRAAAGSVIVRPAGASRLDLLVSRVGG